MKRFEIIDFYIGHYRRSSEQIKGFLKALALSYRLRIAETIELTQEETEQLQQDALLKKLNPALYKVLQKYQAPGTLTEREKELYIGLAKEDGCSEADMFAYKITPGIGWHVHTYETHEMSLADVLLNLERSCNNTEHFPRDCREAYSYVNHSPCSIGIVKRTDFQPQYYGKFASIL
jgi:hypothetical protein